jgi:hypothetical protein
MLTSGPRQRGVSEIDPYQPPCANEPSRCEYYFVTSSLFSALLPSNADGVRQGDRQPFQSGPPAHGLWYLWPLAASCFGRGRVAMDDSQSGCGIFASVVAKRRQGLWRPIPLIHGLSAACPVRGAGLPSDSCCWNATQVPQGPTAGITAGFRINVKALTFWLGNGAVASPLPCGCYLRTRSP